MATIYCWKLGAVGSVDLEQINNMSANTLNSEDAVVYIKEDDKVTSYVTFTEERDAPPLKLERLTALHVSRAGDGEKLFDYMREVFEDDDLVITTSGRLA